MGYSAWSVNEQDFTLLQSFKEKLYFLLRYASLAASSHNTQPWLFRVREDTIDLFADRTRCLPVIDPNDRELIISCGCALFHLQVAARYFGFDFEITRHPDPSNLDHLAHVSFTISHKPISDMDKNLFYAILERRTNRNNYEQTLPNIETLNRLKDVILSHQNCRLKVVSNQTNRKTLTTLITKSDKIQAADVHFRRELASWVHPNRSQHKDGMPGYAFGISDILSNLGPFILRTFDWGGGKAAKDEQLALGSPVLFVLGSDEDEILSWLYTGEALAHLCLQAQSEGLSVSYFNQPIELEEIREQLGKIIELNGYPQLILRLGFCPKTVKPTPRRTLEDICIE